jgi:predicted MPP superfamily phosphohydrolase
MARERRAGSVAPIGRLERWRRRATLGCAAAGLACVAYGWLIEPGWIAVSRVRIASPKLPPGSRAIRIVHVSDFHCESRPGIEARLPDLAAAERPDLIVFTGDAINSLEGLPLFRSCLARLAALAPTFGIRGNWDVRLWNHLDLFAGTGVLELTGEAMRVDVAGTPVWVAGAPHGLEGRLDRALDAVPPGALVIALSHTPDVFDTPVARGADLWCAGHTHGGQVALPLYGALVTLARTGKRYEAGCYRKGGAWLYVSRGIGMEGGLAPRVRFWARPEVAVIEIVPAE